MTDHGNPAFHAVVDNGSFAAAARALSLSTAAVSKNVAELEARNLSVELVEASEFAEDFGRRRATGRR